MNITDDSHLGVASCASSVCHGKLAEQTDRNVWMNEFRIWSNEDRHHRAYQTLLTDESKRIAANLGLPNAHTAKICLDCHADNVPAAKRGPKFQITDGVGCEACHGGGERWVESHTEPKVTHADNLARGMYPTEDPSERARLCLSCHMGTQDQFTTHRIMGAGHPRLVFELESFTANQPAHYAVDEDYIERKRSTVGFGLWLTGQLAAARNFLELIRSDLFTGAGITPELSLYDCHACHHPMNDKRWSSVRRQQGLQPGELRLQDYHFLMLRAVGAALGGDDAATLDRLVTTLLRAGQRNVGETRAASAALADWLATRKTAWLTRTFSTDQIRTVRKTIARQGADGLLSDFASAEQAFYGMESLSYYIDDVEALGPVLDKVFASVEDENKYSPAAFRSACQSALKSF
ncbi:MAG: hypothetical protein H6993_18415 [Pseudomonadales bacterium]|nr:hypothetical protein [Pseudomonadales bacterium]